MARQLTTTIEIAAAPEVVWSILTDFRAYSQWNPFIVDIRGQPQPGSRLEVRICPPGGGCMRFRPTVLDARPGWMLRWVGRVGLRGLFDGDHALRIEPTGENRIRFIQSERFTGILVPLLPARMYARTEEGFRAMNLALKERAEASLA